MVGSTVFWGIDGSDRVAVALVPECLRSLESILDHQLRRPLHVVVYASNDDARFSLERDVPASMLLAPYHTHDAAVIVAQSPDADPRNGNELRMRRQFCHELAHVLAAECTGSLKRLGDGNRNMRLAPWVDEGFAVVAAARAANQLAIVETARKRCAGAQLSDRELDEAFLDHAATQRDLAFAMATVRVLEAVERHGIRFVFHHLDQPSAWRGNERLISSSRGPCR